MKNLVVIQKKLGYKFKNIDIFIEALTHRSFRNTKGVSSNNERLEFLGDAVLELSVTEMLFFKFPNLPEGKLTSYRSSLVKTQSLADESNRLGVGKFIFMNIGEEKTGGRSRPYILANTLEAIIGAIYLDSDYISVKDFIEKNIFYKIDSIIKTNADEDPKSKLQEIAQEEFKITPKYSMVKEFGPDHKKQFWMAAFLNDIKISEGSGISKQVAEQDAAKKALEEWETIKKLIKSRDYA